MDVSSLQALEHLMNEFFAAGTTNSRKQQIEKALEEFSQQPAAWKNCLLCIAGTSNPYVSMFCMTSLESVINKQWLGLRSEERAEIRGSLYRLCLERHHLLAPYLRNKAVKLVVDVARLSWPQFYPDFFSNIITLVQSPDAAPLGLLFLLTAAEELVAPREDISCARRAELRQLLLREVPATLTVLTGILRSVLESNKSNVTATPPPSPEQPRSQRRPDGSPAQHLFAPAANPSTLLSCILTSDGVDKNPFCLMAPLDGETTHIVALTLKCLCQLFSWVPLSSMITSELVTAVFHFASVGFSREGDASDGDRGGGAAGSREPLGVIAIACINEIISKNCVPPDFEAFLLQLFKHTFHLLQRLLEEGSKTSCKLSEVDPDYLSGLTEFLRLFVTLHLRRLEAWPQFPVLDLLALLFRYTFLQPDLDAYYGCLDIWAVFLDHLATKCSLKTENREAVAAKYHEAVLSLAGQALQRTQLRRHGAELERLDDEREDPDGQTEWSELLRRTADLLERVATLYPLDVRALLLTGWHETLEPYVSLPSLCEPTAAGRRLRLAPDADPSRLQAALRDLATHLYMLGRLVSAAAFGSAQRLHEAELPPGALRPTLVEVHAQSLATLRPWCHWMTAALAGHLSTSVQVDDLVAEMTVAVTVRSGALVDCPQIQQLYGRAGQLTLGKQDRLLLYRALSSLLLLPWQRAGDQLWEERRRHLAVFLDSLTADFRRLRLTPGLADSRELRDRAKPVISQTLSTLSEIVTNVRSEVTKTKQLCHDCLQDTIRDSLWVFTVFAAQPDVCQDVLSFFLAAFEALRAQMGGQFAEQCVQMFIDVFSRDALARNMLEEAAGLTPLPLPA
ncbi:exportin-6-like [Pollicipes pollicipes]|uniref:exportin-6-like n=1 Tax=Pollicipes pollicipes TaxID=41117 RepID=UPI0018852D75|nr:exportin-6-like [Pollicipes pollicipes]